MKVDKAGLEFIKQLEGFEAKPYQDSAGVWTNGYGHTENVSANTEPITEAQAQKFLIEDLGSPERMINRYVTIDINQNEFNALVSFVYNEGPERLLTSTLLKKLLEGDRKGAAKEFERWVFYRHPVTKEMQISQGLVERRRAEKTLFLTPVVA